MDPFAALVDLEVRWRPMQDETEGDRASILLDDASMMIRSQKPTADTLAASDPVFAASLKIVTCAVVKRAMQAPAGMEGVGQFQQSGGPFSQNLTFSNPGGDLYLTKAEKRRLGIGGQRAFSIDLLTEDESSSESSSS